MSSLVFRLSVVLPVIAVGATFAVVSLAANQAPTPAVAPAAAAQANPNCALIVPPDALRANGLATPYQLVATDRHAGPCHEADANQSAFVEATIIDPATGALSVYRPLVVDAGQRPAAPPVVPKLPANAVVGIWFGFNGDTLTLKSDRDSLADANCVNGYRDSIFGQFAFCDASQFFTAANAAIAAGKLPVPALGTARDGLPCLTTRDFGLVDQDQSDNVVTSYLMLPDGRVAQNNGTNVARLHHASTLVNGSDNLLVDGFVDPALGCRTFTAPDLTNPGQRVSSLALNELLAAARQQAPIALVPTNDPMTARNGKPSTAKTNLYRAGVDQPRLTSAQSPTEYCRQLLAVGGRRIQLDRGFTVRAPSPDPAAANDLYTFLAQRWSGSLTTLGCASLITVGDPVKLVTNKAGVVVDAVFARHVDPVFAPQDAPVPNADSTAAAQAPLIPGKF